MAVGEVLVLKQYYI